MPRTNVMSLIGQLLIHLPQVTLPVYLNNTRAELLFTLDFKAEGMTEEGDHHYYERGVALLSSPL